MTPQIADATTIEELHERYGEAWNSQDLDAILAMHTDDGVFQLYIPGAAPAEGKQAIREAFGGFLAQLPDINFAVRKLNTGAGHWVSEMTLTGTVAAPLQLDGEAIESPGAKIEVPCVDVIEVRDGLVATKHTYLDEVTFQNQLQAS
jgi:steroid delta-isomerase-like uncharacterized protein